MARGISRSYQSPCEAADMSDEYPSHGAFDGGFEIQFLFQSAS
jgi:hypothetical protein